MSMFHVIKRGDSSSLGAEESDDVLVAGVGMVDERLGVLGVEEPVDELDDAGDEVPDEEAEAPSRSKAGWRLGDGVFVASDARNLMYSGYVFSISSSGTGSRCSK